MFIFSDLYKHGLNTFNKIKTATAFSLFGKTVWGEKKMHHCTAVNKKKTCIRPVSATFRIKLFKSTNSFSSF